MAESMSENLEIENTMVDDGQTGTEDTTALASMRAAGAQLAAKLGWLPGTTSSGVFAERSRRVRSAAETWWWMVRA